MRRDIHKQDEESSLHLVFYGSRLVEEPMPDFCTVSVCMSSILTSMYRFLIKKDIQSPFINREHERTVGPQEEWESHFDPTRREHRDERKRAQRADRSKFKHTDLGKEKQRTRSSETVLLTGRVTQIRSQEIIVVAEKKVYSCSLKGFLKFSKDRQKNLVTVGDAVSFEIISPGAGCIHAVLPRTSLLSREDHLHRRNQQLVVANVDQLFITVSVAEPALRTPIIDRYLIAARKGHLSPILLINKWDRLLENPGEAHVAEEVVRLYRSLGIPVLCVSAVTGEGFEQLQVAMTHKTSVFSGQSGTGKTCLVNRLTGLSMRTGMIRAVGKGCHTTTTTQLLELPFEGWVVDTPGLRSLGIFDLEKKDLKDEFCEIFSQPCEFTNCWHSGEKGCAVLKGVEEGHVSPVRFSSYLSLLASLEGDSPLFASHRSKKSN